MQWLDKNDAKSETCWSLFQVKVSGRVIVFQGEKYFIKVLAFCIHYFGHC